MATFDAVKFTEIDGKMKRTTVAEEREVSVLGWQSYENLKNKLKIATEQGKMTQERSEYLSKLCENVCLDGMSSGDI